MKNICTRQSTYMSPTKHIRRFIVLLCCTLTLPSCYDDTELWDRIKDHESRIKRLEELCEKMNTNIQSLQTLTTILQEKDFVTGVAPINENGKDTGYTIVFASGKSITIHNGKDGKDGINGKDGAAARVPVIGIRKDSDGIYYWTVDGEWLLDDSNEKVPASGEKGKDGVTPQIKVYDENWYISYDEGESWEKLESGTDETNGEIEVDYDSDNIYIKFPDNTMLEIPRAPISKEINIYITAISESTVTFEGSVPADTDSDETGVIISEEPTLTLNSSDMIPIVRYSAKGEFSLMVDNLKSGSQYYYAAYESKDGAYTIGAIKSFITKSASSASGTPELTSLKVTVDKKVIKADGIDKATITVSVNGTDKTKEAEFYNGGTRLDDEEFSTHSTGTHIIQVRYGDLSDEVRIEAIEYDIPEIPYDLYYSRTDFAHRALLTNYTGLGCMFGVLMECTLNKVCAEGLIPDKAVLTAVHSYHGNKGATYIAQPTANGYPTLKLNSAIDFYNGNDVEVLIDYIEGIAESKAHAGISVSSALYDNSVIVVKVRVKAAEKGNYKAGIWLLENSVAGLMTGPDDQNIQRTISSHDNCARYIDDICLNAGYSLGTLGRRETEDAVFYINIDPEWEAKALHLVATVSKEGEDNEFTTCNAVSCMIDEAVPFEYRSDY